MPSAASAAPKTPRRDTPECFMVLLPLLFQDRVQTVEDRHPPLEQVVIVRRRFGKRPDGQVDAGRFVARELAVVKIGFVDDLRDEPDASILDPETLDQGFEGALVAVVAELGSEYVERNSLARRVRGVRERERGVGVAEALDEPGRGDPV